MDSMFFRSDEKATFGGAKWLQELNVAILEYGNDFASMLSSFIRSFKHFDPPFRDPSDTGDGAPHLDTPQKWQNFNSSKQDGKVI